MPHMLLSQTMAVLRPGGYLTPKWIRVFPHNIASAVGVGAKKTLPLWVQNILKVTLMGAKFAKKPPLKGYF